LPCLLGELITARSREPHFAAPAVREIAALPHLELAYDLARLELAATEVLEAEPATPLAAADFQAVPTEAWHRATLKTITGFVLLALDWPANAVASAVYKEQPLPPLVPGASWVCVWRRGYDVWRMDLSRVKFTLLEALAEKRTLLESIEMAARAWEGGEEDFESEVFRWFREWVGDGLFQAVEAP
jgi:hypothetical protein